MKLRIPIRATIILGSFGASGAVMLLLCYCAYRTALWAYHAVEGTHANLGGISFCFVMAAFWGVMIWKGAKR